MFDEEKIENYSLYVEKVFYDALKAGFVKD